MTRGRVAVVSPREDRRESARAWAPLLDGRAEISLCDTPLEAPIDADLVVVDEDCEELDSWLAGPGDRHREPGSIVVFGTAGASRRGAIPWGDEGAEVLATISDLLDRRRLLEDSDEFLESLRSSNARLDEQRRRFARLVVEQAEGLRGANVSLSREVDRLGRLQTLARFFAAPGPDETFGDRLAEVAGRALGAAGLAVVRRDEDVWSLLGRWRVSARAAIAAAPSPEAASRAAAHDLPTTRKEHVASWLPLGDFAGAVALFREASERPDPELVAELQALLADGLGSREEARADLARLSLAERVVHDLRGGLMKIDAAGHVVLANPALAAILGTDPEHLEGRPVAEVFAGDPHLQELLRTPSGDEIQTFLTVPPGRRIAVALRVSALSAGPHGEGGVLVLVSDLSRRQEVEAEVRRADRLASLGRLSAGVAHEIRNPLAGIRTTAELLRGRVGDRDELARFVDVILEESARLDRIVGSLLQFAKPSAPRREPVAVRPLLDRVASLSGGRAAERGVRVRVDVPEGLREPLADRDQILQVLLNLVLNGVDATPAGGEVRLGAEIGSGGRELLLVVEDGGQGVPAPILDRVFDPFFTTKPGGTGLGLSISQNIVAQHGGRLRFEREGSGPNRALVALPWDGGGTREGRTWRTS